MGSGKADAFGHGEHTAQVIARRDDDDAADFARFVQRLLDGRRAVHFTVADCAEIRDVEGVGQFTSILSVGDGTPDVPLFPPPL